MNNIQRIMVSAQIALLTESMIDRKPIVISKPGISNVTIDGTRFVSSMALGIVNSIEAEDGSGHKFNVRLMNIRQPYYLDLAEQVYVIRQ